MAPAAATVVDSSIRMFNLCWFLAFGEGHSEKRTVNWVDAGTRPAAMRIHMPGPTRAEVAMAGSS